MNRLAAKLVELLPASRAANVWAMLALSPLLMFFGSITYLIGSRFDALYVLTALFFSRLVSTLVVLFAKQIIFRALSKPSAWRLILLYFLGGLGDSIVLILMLDIAWVPPGDGLSAWAVSTVSTTIVASWLLMSHLAAALLGQNIDHYSELQIKNAQLKQLADNASNELRRHQQNLQVEISQRVHGVLDKISAQLEQLDFQSDPQAILITAQNIREASEEDIRGLSHELSARESEALLPQIPKRKISWREMWRIDGQNSANISWVVAFGALMIFSMSIAVGSWLVTLVAAITLTIGVPVLTLVDRGRKALTKSLPAWIQVLSIPIEYVVFIMAGIEIVRFATQDLAEVQELLSLFEVAVPVGALFIWLLSFTIRGLSSSIRQRTSQLESTSKSLEQTLERLQSQLREVRSRLARLLHGSVQGRLASVSLALAATAGRNDKALSDEMGFKAREQLELARKDLAEAFADMREVQIFSAALNDLLAGWSGLIDFDINLDNSIESALDADSMLGEIVIHAMQECFTNAVRHGLARRIRFDFSAVDGSSLMLVATNDGTTAAKEFKPGLGWQTMIADATSVEMAATDSEFKISITWALTTATK